MSRYLKMACFYLCMFSDLPHVVGQADSKSNTIGLDFGYQLIQYQDLIFSNMIYSGSGFGPINLVYNMQSSKAILAADVNYSSTSIAPENLIRSPAFAQRSESAYASIGMDLSYTRSFYKGTKLSAYAGIRLNASYTETDIQFGLGSETSYTYVNALGPKVYINYQLPFGFDLGADFSMPLVSLVSRPEYGIVDNENIQGKEGLGLLYGKSEIVTVNKYLAPAFDLSLSKSFGSSFAGFLIYRFEYTHVSIPDLSNILKSSIGMGINYKP